jgi:diadenosine tetraphosphate (Ap4A) HIT family hydrolase
MEYQLHPDLERDGISLGHFPLCQLLLINDSRYPWFVLVPRRGGISEAFELPEADYRKLGDESQEFGRMIKTLLAGDKLNVAALGNVTPQLHIHHIVRFRGDEVWPAPVWGRGLAQPYKDGELLALLEKLQPALRQLSCGFVWEDPPGLARFSQADQRQPAGQRVPFPGEPKA